MNPEEREKDKAVDLAPLPWRRDGTYLQDANGVDILSVATGRGPEDDERIAEGVLVAMNAHTALLAACKALLAAQYGADHCTCDSSSGFTCLACFAKEAIALAEGEGITSE